MHPGVEIEVEISNYCIANWFSVFVMHAKAELDFSNESTVYSFLVQLGCSFIFWFSSCPNKSCCRERILLCEVQPVQRVQEDRGWRTTVTNDGGFKKDNTFVLYHIVLLFNLLFYHRTEKQSLNPLTHIKSNHSSFLHPYTTSAFFHTEKNLSKSIPSTKTLPPAIMCQSIIDSFSCQCMKASVFIPCPRYTPTSACADFKTIIMDSSGFSRQLCFLHKAAEEVAGVQVQVEMDTEQLVQAVPPSELSLVVDKNGNFRFLRLPSAISDQVKRAGDDVEELEDIWEGITALARERHERRMEELRRGRGW